MTRMNRFFSTSAASLFKKESANLIKNSNALKSPATISTRKWKPTDGNSFRSFAEYRLKVTNQSPLNKEVHRRFGI